jgi:predicted O-methyltransferase YrrM
VCSLTSVYSIKSLPKDHPPFDLIFIDADKTSYLAYLSLILTLSEPDSKHRLLRPGGVIMADNVLKRGLVADSSEANPFTHSDSTYSWDKEDVKVLDEYNKTVKAEKRLEALMLPLYDGLNLARIVD